MRSHSRSAPIPADAASARIGFLLEEYKALRAEITQRTSSRASLLGFLVAAAALATRPTDPSGAWLWILLAVVSLLAGLAYWWRSGQLVKRLGIRVAELEDTLNRLADIAYGPILDRDLAANAKLGWENSLRRR